MRKFKFLLFSICLCFMFVNYVDAAEIKLSTDKNSVLVGDNVSVKLGLILSSETLNISYCKVDISYATDLEFKEAQALNSWTISNKNIVDNVLSLNIKNYKNQLSNGVNITELKYKVNKNTSLKIKSASCYDEDDEQLSDILYNQEELKISAITPSNNELKTLKINNADLKPYFTPNVRSYSVNNFNSDSLSLAYELVDSSYQNKVQVLVNDKPISSLDNIPYELSSDNKAMLITINVDEKSSYNIFVSKKNASSDINYLQSITVNGTALELVPGKFDYNFVVSDDVTSAEVLAEIYDNSQFQFSSSSSVPATFKMPGKEVVVLNVVPKDSKSGIPSVTYTVTINNQSYVPGVKNPDTADTSMYIILGLLILSLVGSTVMYQKNLNGYK